MVSKIGIALALMTLLAGAVSASASGHRTNELFTSRPTESEITVRAPEVDPASAMAALTLLAGGLAVLRGRRAEK